MGGKINESRWHMSVENLNFSLLSVTAMRSGCFGTWLHVSDSEAHLNLLRGPLTRSPILNRCKWHFWMHNSSVSARDRERREDHQACDLCFPQCDRCLKIPVHHLPIIVFFMRKGKIPFQITTPPAANCCDWNYLILFIPCCFGPNDPASVLNTAIIVPSTTSALSGVHWLCYPDSKSRQAKWCVTCKEAVGALRYIKLHSTVK